jgi:hypothetical protein
MGYRRYEPPAPLQGLPGGGVGRGAGDAVRPLAPDQHVAVAGDGVELEAPNPQRLLDVPDQLAALLAREVAGGRVHQPLPVGVDQVRAEGDVGRVVRDLDGRRVEGSAAGERLPRVVAEQPDERGLGIAGPV